MDLKLNTLGMYDLVLLLSWIFGRTADLFVGQFYFLWLLFSSQQLTGYAFSPQQAEYH
jgi:hypothetical protein